MILKGSLFPETPNWGLPRSPSTKTRGKLHLFPQTLNILQCCPRYTSPKWFSPVPSAIPSRIPTRLFGPLPPQTFHLLLGWSSLTSKGITVHSGVIDSDYKGEIQIMMSSQILWQFKKGEKIAQFLFYLTFLLTPLMIYRQVDLVIQIKSNPYGHQYYLNMHEQI